HRAQRRVATRTKEQRIWSRFLGTKEHLAAETNGEHQPCLKGDHPYRTTTRFQRDACGKLLRDDAGFLIPVIPPKDEKLTSRETTPEERAEGRERARQKREAEDKVI